MEHIENLVRNINYQLNEMSEKANRDIVREKERSREWCEYRWQRFHEESRALREQRDHVMKMMCDTQIVQPVIVGKD